MSQPRGFHALLNRRADRRDNAAREKRRSLHRNLLPQYSPNRDLKRIPAARHAQTRLRGDNRR